MSAPNENLGGNRLPTPSQFSLRTLLVVVGGFAVFFTAASKLPLTWTAALVCLLALASAHVVGNSLGTRLREIGSLQPPEQLENSRQLQTKEKNGLCSIPATQLGDKSPLNRQVTLCITVSSCVAGLVLGCLLVFRGDSLRYANMTWLGMALGILSCGVLGAFLGFAFSSFWRTLHGAWNEAVRGKPGSQ